MDTLLVQMFLMSQGSEPVIEQELACIGACGVTGGSGAIRVGMDTWIVQVLVIP